MPVRRSVAALLTALAFLSPAAALGQSAGDEQYQDPLAGSGGGGGGGGEDSDPAPEATAAPTTAPSTSSTPVPSTDAGAAAAAATPGTSVSGDPDQLPYTGLPAGLVGGAGVLLLAGGVAMRVRLRRCS